MKIEERIKGIELREMRPGEVYKYKGEYFIVTDKYEVGKTIMTVNLQNGRVNNASKSLYVIPVNAKVVIE